MPINFTVNYDDLTNDIDDDTGDIGTAPGVGPVRFIPQIREGARALAPDYSPRPAGIGFRTFTGYLDTDGRLKNKPGGTPGVRLWANDPVLNLDRLPYKVVADLTDPLGRKVPFTPFVFEAPATDTPLNLVTVIPVVAAQGRGLTQGPRGFPGADATNLPTVDVRSFLAEGASLVSGDDITTLMNTARTAMAAWTVGKSQIYVPGGEFILNDWVPASKIGVKGAGQNTTIFKPTGTHSAIRGYAAGDVPADLSGSATLYTDLEFSDFTIDGVNQSGPANTSTAKGIFVQFLMRCRISRVTIKNTLGTGFGLDYLRDSVYENCYAENCGRSMVDQTGAGAGFGIATGYYDVENLTITNCVSKNNRTHGFFTENKDSGPTKFSKGFKLIGCHAEGNYNGWRDGGSGDALVQGCTFVNNISDGAVAAATPANTHSGINGRIVDCPSISNNGGNGVSLSGASGYVVERNNIANNTVRGVNRSGTAPSVCVTIRGNMIRSNGQSGVGALTAGAIDRWAILDNDIIDNGTDVGATYRDGVTINCSTTGLRIRSNRCYNTAGSDGTQQRGIDLRASGNTSVKPIVQDNDVRGNALEGASALRAQHTIADSTYIANNIVDARPGQVTGLAAVSTTGVNQVISWTAPAGTITNYKVQWRATGSTTSWSAGDPNVHSANSAVTNYTVTGLTADTQYDYRVYAQNDDGDGAASTTLTTFTGASGVTTYVADNFTTLVAEVNTRVCPVGNKTWARSGTGATTASGGGAAPTVSSGNAFWTLPSGQANGTFRAKITTVGDRSIQIVARYVDASNMIAVTRVSGADAKYRLCKRVAGTLSTVATAASATMTDGDIVEIVMSGTSVSVKVNGTEIIAAQTITEGSTATSHGFGGGTTIGGAVVDDIRMAA